jgi:hypothetical protein
MLNSNSINRIPFASSWFFVGGMSVLTLCLMGLIFVLVKSYPGVLYDTLNIYLNDPKVDRLVIEVEALEDQLESLVAELEAHKRFINHYDVVVMRHVALGLTLGISTGILLKYVAFFLG